jgi:hypothetical protein
MQDIIQTGNLAGRGGDLCTLTLFAWLAVTGVLHRLGTVYAFSLRIIDCMKETDVN